MLQTSRKGKNMDLFQQRPEKLQYMSEVVCLKHPLHSLSVDLSVFCVASSCSSLHDVDRGAVGALLFLVLKI